MAASKHTLEERLDWHLRKYHYRLHEVHQWEQGARTAHHWKNARALARAEGEIHKWMPLLHEEEHEIGRLRSALHKMQPPPAKTTAGVVMFDGHPTASWMVPILVWGRHHGWPGIVVSGYRTPSAQWAAAIHYAAQLGRSVWSVYPSGPLASNHCKYTWPGGAVDVTDYVTLYHVLKGYPGPHHLIWAGLTIGDNVHFSANGH